MNESRIANRPVVMVDVSDKQSQHRMSRASGKIYMKPETIHAIHENQVEKGNPLAVAQVAGILAAKKVSELIPLCHQIPLSNVDIRFFPAENHILAECSCVSDAKTGVEMEALTAVNVALLTIWDMVKYLEKDKKGQYPHTRISDIIVIEKRKE